MDGVGLMRVIVIVREERSNWRWASIISTEGHGGRGEIVTVFAGAPCEEIVEGAEGEARVRPGM